MGWQHVSPLGQLRNLAPHRPYRSSLPHGRRITFYQPPQGLGRCPKTALHGMAYLLVRVDDTSEPRTYGMALVWISPLQAKVSSMVEALEILSSLTSKGSDWPYILIQLYEGANHMPLPEGQTYLCPAPGEGGKPKWVDKPTKNLLASICTGHVGCLPHRVEQGQPVGDHWFAQIIAHWLLCHHWWVSLHRGQHSYAYSRRAGLCKSALLGKKAWHSNWSLSPKLLGSLGSLSRWRWTI